MNNNRYPGAIRRGQALIISLALVLCLMLVAAATQIQVVAQLNQTKRERDYERALQMAEAGANAYLNELANGFVNNTYTYMPPYNSDPRGDGGSPLLTIEQFKTQAANGTIPAAKLRNYPSGTTRQGFYVEQFGSGASVQVVVYGWSHDVVRRVTFGASSFSVFDWAAIYGVNPLTTGTNYCWKFSGSANVVGACGGEGVLNNSNNATFYDGPIIWAGTGTSSNPDPAVTASSANVPTGHSGTGTLASPLYRHYQRTLNLETADQAANSWALSSLGVTTTQGVEYYRTHNHNSTGIRYLVRDGTTGVIRELSGNYTVMSNNDYSLDGEFNPNSSTLTNLGKTSSESFYGLRLYPGNYFFEQITMGNSDNLYLRTFNDSERSTISGRAFVVSGDPANPNSGQSSNKNVRIWLGHKSSGNDLNTTFYTGTQMEYTNYSSRFRVYVASSGSMTIHGTNANPPPPFRVNMLAYNKDNSGNGYGTVSFSSGTYMYGSLIAWQIDVAGGCTIQKDATEQGQGEDRLTYMVNTWKELP